MRNYISAREPRSSLLKKRDFDPSTLIKARQRGAADRAIGATYLSNPFLTDDPRFAGWNDGYLGADDVAAIDVPDSHRPPPPQKPTID